MDAVTMEISTSIKSTILTETTTTTAAATHQPFSSTTEKQLLEKSDLFNFAAIDYTFFVLLLCLSTVIGIYYGFFSKHKQNTTSEYILGGRSMKILPVATSMIAT